MTRASLRVTDLCCILILCLIFVVLNALGLLKRNISFENKIFPSNDFLF